MDKTKNSHCAVRGDGGYYAGHIVCTGNAFWQATCPYYAVDEADGMTCTYFVGDLTDFDSPPLCTCGEVEARFRNMPGEV